MSLCALRKCLTRLHRSPTAWRLARLTISSGSLRTLTSLGQSDRRSIEQTCAASLTCSWYRSAGSYMSSAVNAVNSGEARHKSSVSLSAHCSRLRHVHELTRPDTPNLSVEEHKMRVSRLKSQFAKDQNACVDALDNSPQDRQAQQSECGRYIKPWLVC